MPYSGPDDEKLPSNVQKLPKPQREKWVKTWNSTFENCRDATNGGGAGSVEKCEATAFKIANGTIKKEATVGDENMDAKTPENEVAIGMTPAEKMYGGDGVVAIVEQPYKPFGGAQSFEELDEFVKVQDQAYEVNKVTWATQDLIGNVMRDDDTENKPNKLQQIVDGMRARLGQALTKSAEAVAPSKTEVKEDKELPVKGFQVLKSKDGSLRWIGIPTNKWRDRDMPAQIISEAAHREFVEYIDKTKEYPELLSWHTPGTRIGIADVVDYSHGFLVMGGPIDKDKYAEAERLAAKCQTEDIGMSHGFVYTYSDKANEIIGHYRIWEVSHLPTAVAANVWTAIDILKKEVSKMSFNAEKREYLVGLHGEEMVASLEAKAVDLEKDLALAGVEWKEAAGEESSNAIMEATAKAIVESEGFKALIDTVATQGAAIKEMQTLMNTIQTAVESATNTADTAKETAKTSLDKALSDLITSRSSAFQPSKDAPKVTDAEKDDLGGPAAEMTGFEPGFMEKLTQMPGAQNLAVPTPS